jgi:hypothetical protein
VRELTFVLRRRSPRARAPTPVSAFIFPEDDVVLQKSIPPQIRQLIKVKKK